MQEKESKTNWHFRISLYKSSIRIFAGVLLSLGDLVGAGLGLIIAEFLGIAEELF